ncbi:MAG: hypothetical protein DRH37_01645 [Deltaproteobacteria bacterium]|nr:MAG: hypothetical protein DRH37_01645 [Deltaproteobacteria bacterium]
MNFLDRTIICFYLSGMVLYGMYLGRGRREQEDYYVGGRRLPWWTTGISTMATQTSAISLISVPALLRCRHPA